ASRRRRPWRRADSHRPLTPFKSLLRGWWPAAQPIDARERWRVVVGAGIGLLVTGAGTLLSGLHAGMPWLIAPLGASAGIVFALPTSPLAQPWSVIGGNTLSGLVAITVLHLMPAGSWPPLAPALAVALAIAVMLNTRCLHPPGGAVALFVSMSGVVDWRFAA